MLLVHDASCYYLLLLLLLLQLVVLLVTRPPNGNANDSWVDCIPLRTFVNYTLDCPLVVAACVMPFELRPDTTNDIPATSKASSLPLLVIFMVM